MMMNDLKIKPRTSGGGSVNRVDEQTWRLEIPAGRKDRFRLAQLDDYAGLTRQSFLWQPPFKISWKVRTSSREIPGTWGLGLWNDPFSASLGLGGADRRLPALPEAVWFFFAAPQNYLSVHDELPGWGFLAATFQSVPVKPLWVFLGSPFLAGLFVPGVNRLGRAVARKLVRQDAAQINVDPTHWHTYSLEWADRHVQLSVDGQVALDSPIAPRPPLGLVIWIDNQYAAWTPDGRVRLGNLVNPEPAWIEVAFSGFA